MTDNPAGEDPRRTGDTDGARQARDRARAWSAPNATLVLSDGETFRGTAFGAEPADGTTVGPLTVSTVMAGYQEVISDPAHDGNVVVFSYPQIGNVGVNASDDRGSTSGCAGVIVRDLARLTSNWQTEDDLDHYMECKSIAGITGLDTRRLVRHLSANGPLHGAFGTADPEVLLQAARSANGSTTVSDGDGDAQRTENAR